MIRKLRDTLSPHFLALGVLVLYIGLTVLITWPLALQMHKAVIGWMGDNFYFVWLVGWFQKSLLELHQFPLVVPSINYPEGWNLAYNEVTPAMTLIALPASFIGGPVFGYNFSLFFSFVLSGFGVYLWVRRITHDVSAGIIAGTIFAFIPYRMSHLLGHLNLMGTQWFPFYFMSISDLLENRSWSWRAIGSAAIFLGLIGLTSQYYLYMTLLISVIYISGYLLLVDHKLVFQSEFWKKFMTFAILALPLVFTSVWPYLQLAKQGNLPSRSFDEVRIWSASPTDFILPSPEHFIWGEWVVEKFGQPLWIESTLYLGVVALGFAVLAFVKRKQLVCSKVRLFTFTGVMAFILALGTDLHWLGHSIVVNVPQFIQRWHPYPKTFIPLPGYFLFKYLPFYANMRVWMRYGIFVNLFVTLLAGIGIAWVLSKLQRNNRVLITALILVLVLVDFYPGSPLISPVQGRPVDTWLSTQAGEGAVVQFPVQLNVLPDQMYYTLIHNKPFIGGFFAAYVTPQFARIQPVLDTFPNQESVAILQELGVQWIVVDSSQYEDFSLVHPAIESLGLEFIGIIETQYLYILN